MKRHDTAEVFLGKLGVGGSHPVSVEAMGRTHPSRYRDTLDEIRLAQEAGCEIFRLAIPDEESLEGLKKITAESPLPLVADIHFAPQLALSAAGSGVGAVRVNPGTMGERAQYRELVLRLADYGCVLRLGANAASLPKAFQKMKPSQALVCCIAEWLEEPLKLSFHNIILSAKSSSIEVNEEASRNLSHSFPYPIHIGLTEAGEGTDGIIQSTLGIGMLLREGIGNTIRVSLTSSSPVLETQVGVGILNALGLRRRGFQIISCPTCARKKGDVVLLVCELKKRLGKLKQTVPLTVAVMGCEVNGPGEAREADVGLAFGRERAVIFSRGVVVETVPHREGMEALLESIITFTPPAGKQLQHNS